MIVLGLLLLAAVAVVVIAAVASGDEPATLGLVGANIDTSVRWVFLTGALSVLVLVLGTSLLMSGLRRARARRNEVKQLKAAAGPTAESPRVRRAGEPAPARQREVRDVSSRPIRPEDPDERSHFESAPRE
jgi:hypothetical protein